MTFINRYASEANRLFTFNSCIVLTSSTDIDTTGKPIVTLNALCYTPPWRSWTSNVAAPKRISTPISDNCMLWPVDTDTYPEPSSRKQVYSAEFCEKHGMTQTVRALLWLQRTLNERNNTLVHDNAEIQKWYIEQKRRAWERRRHALMAYEPPSAEEYEAAVVIVDAKLSAEAEEKAAAMKALADEEAAHARKSYYQTYNYRYRDDDDDDDSYPSDDDEPYCIPAMQPSSLSDVELLSRRIDVQRTYGYSILLVTRCLNVERKQMRFLQKKLRECLSDISHTADPVTCIKYLFE